MSEVNIDVAGLRAALSRLNPDARIVPAVRGRVPREQVLGTGLFDAERAQQAPGQVKELGGDHVPETEEYGIDDACEHEHEWALGAA